MPAEVAHLDVQAGYLFSAAVKQLLSESKVEPSQISAIGSHGQTLYHAPDDEFPYTWQIGDPNVIAQDTGITTVADFRRRDIAAGGQGAPLVPIFHEALFRSCTEDRVILNIGGIANISVLSADSQKALTGFDSGPGNALLDAWAQRHLNTAMDKDSAWAATGKANSDLLNTLLQDAYFKRAAPKSTGRDYFGLNWLEKYLTPDLAPEDVQATLIQLSVQSIANAVCEYAPQRLLVCGGGTHNPLLMQGLSQQLNNCTVASTQEYGVDPDWIEAMCFAWLAKQRQELKPGNVPQVTGASQEVILGAIYAGNHA